MITKELDNFYSVPKVEKMKGDGVMVINFSSPIKEPEFGQSWLPYVNGQLSRRYLSREADSVYKSIDSEQDFFQKEE